MRNALLIFLLLVFVSAVLILLVAANKKFEKAGSPDRVALDYSAIHANLKKNCNNDYVYALTSDECQELCIPTNTFVSKNGICVNSAVLHSEGIVNECSPKNGLFAYLVGDGQFGKIEARCLSIDPGIQPDNIKEPNKICINASTNTTIDYLKEFPLYTYCNCADDETLVKLPATNTVRDRGVCIKNTLNDIFQ